MKKIFQTAIVFSLLTGMLHAQGFDATSLAMGKAFGGVARGVESLTWNPANLGLPRGSWFEMNFVGLNFNIGNSALSLDDYKRYLTDTGHGGSWDEKDKQDLLDMVPEDGFNINAEAGANALGVVFGRYGFGVQGVGRLNGLIPKGQFEMILFGNISNLYNFNDLDADGFAALKFTLAGSQPIKLSKFFKSFSLGLNLNYYRAFEHVELKNSSGLVYTGLDYLYADAQVLARTAEGGNGFSMDLGGAGEIGDQWTISMVFRNLLGSITWNENPEAHFYNLEIDSAKYKSSLDIEPGVTDTSYVIDPYKTQIPVVFHMGVAYLPSKKVTLALDVEQAFSKGLGYSENALLSVGTEYRPVDIVPLRAGMTFGGKWGFMMGLGVGFHFKALQVNIGYASHRSLWPGSTKGFSTAVDIKIVI
jgi:hypothetical protein